MSGLNFSPVLTTMSTPFFTSYSFTLSETYIFQKDERALPGKLQSRSPFCTPSHLK
jgi:hypothetical protein